MPRFESVDVGLPLRPCRGLRVCLTQCLEFPRLELGIEQLDLFGVSAADLPQIGIGAETELPEKLWNMHCLRHLRLLPVLLARSVAGIEEALLFDLNQGGFELLARTADYMVVLRRQGAFEPHDLIAQPLALVAAQLLV